MTENIEAFSGCLFTAEERDTIQRLMSIGKARAELAKKEQLVDQLGRFNRESMYTIRDQMDSIPVPFNEDFICGLGIARPSEERVNNFLRRHGTDDAAEVAHDQAEEIVKENSDNDAEKKLVLDRVKYILARIQEATEELTVAFLELNIPQSPYRNHIADVIIDYAIRWPEYCGFYAELCAKQINKELSICRASSLLRDALLVRAQYFCSRSENDAIAEKKRDMDAETDQERKQAKMDALLKALGDARKAKFGTIWFLGHLYQENIVSNRIIFYLFCGLLKNNLDNCEADEDSIDCAINLMTLTGRRLQILENIWCSGKAHFVLACSVHVSPGRIIALIGNARPIVSKRLRRKIDDLVALRDGGWVAKA